MEVDEIRRKLTSLLVGQREAVDRIVEYITIYESGLSSIGRPAGVFMLMGPTGVGKTRTVEALAETMHGTSASMIRVDCGEFHTDHEVAKLLGAPPGYLGHRESLPLITQQKLGSITSSKSNVSLVLFDEIEKAAASVHRVLLSSMDKGRMTLGDNTTVNFENTMIFMSSNIGWEEMKKDRKGFGYRNDLSRGSAPAMAALKRRFSPEFLNRIDVILNYNLLTRENFRAILDNLLEEFQFHIVNRLAEKGFALEVTDEAKEFLLDVGTSDEFGGRELKRVLNRHVRRQVAILVAENRVPPGSEVLVKLTNGEIRVVVGEASIEQLLTVATKTARKRNEGKRP